jgi:hypothetical protein
MSHLSQLYTRRGRAFTGGFARLVGQAFHQNLVHGCVAGDYSRYLSLAWDDEARYAVFSTKATPFLWWSASTIELFEVDLLTLTVRCLHPYTLALPAQWIRDLVKREDPIP